MADQLENEVAIVCAQNPECPDTFRALAFFTRQGREIPFELVSYGTHRAEELWEASRRLLGEKSGHPLVCIFVQGGNDGPVVSWAGSEPKTADLFEALLMAGFEVFPVEVSREYEIIQCCVVE